MYRVFCTMVLVLSVAALMGPQFACAGTLDSASFTYKYEMDVDPATQDLDSNTVLDWNSDLSAGGSASFLDGIMTADATAANTATTCYYSQGAGQIWKQSGITESGGWTVETRIKVDPVSAGWAGATAIRVGTATGNEAILNLRTTGLEFSTFGSGVEFAADTTDDFHVYRLAGKNSVFSLWMDGNLLSDSLTSPHGANYDFNPGDGGSPWGPGRTFVDYLRFTPGVYSPVPEPSSIVMLLCTGFGLLAYAWRKRK